MGHLYRSYVTNNQRVNPMKIPLTLLLMVKIMLNTTNICIYNIIISHSDPMNIPWKIIAMALLKPYLNHFRLPVTKASLFRDPWSSTTAVCAIFTTFAQHFGWLWRSNGGFHSHGGIPSSLDGLFMFISMGKFNSNEWMIGFYLDMGGIHINQMV